MPRGDNAGRSKKADVIMPMCADSRECRFRNADDRCELLTSTYEKDGTCPWCKPYEDKSEKAAKSPERKRSPGQVVDEYLSLSARHVREPGCQFYIGTSKVRLGCTATHNETCKGCKFYSANHAERTRAVAAYLLQTDKDVTQMRSELKTLRRATKHLDELTGYARIGKSVVRYANKRRESNHE